MSFPTSHLASRKNPEQLYKWKAFIGQIRQGQGKSRLPHLSLGDEKSLSDGLPQPVLTRKLQTDWLRLHS